MKKLSQILKIAMNKLSTTSYLCFALDLSWELDEISREEYDLARSEIKRMLGKSSTIPVWIVDQGVDDDYDCEELRYLVVSAWIDKLESEGL